MALYPNLELEVDEDPGLSSSILTATGCLYDAIFSYHFVWMEEPFNTQNLS